MTSYDVLGKNYKCISTHVSYKWPIDCISVISFSIYAAVWAVLIQRKSVFAAMWRHHDVIILKILPYQPAFDVKHVHTSFIPRLVFVGRLYSIAQHLKFCVGRLRGYNVNNHLIFAMHTWGYPSSFHFTVYHYNFYWFTVTETKFHWFTITDIFETFAIYRYQNIQKVVFYHYSTDYS